VREVEALADLAVRKPFGRELGDLELFGAELGPGVRRSTAGAFTGCTQLADGAVGVPLLGEGVEDQCGVTQRPPRVGVSVLSPQPFAVSELCAWRGSEVPATGGSSGKGSGYS